MQKLRKLDFTQPLSLFYAAILLISTAGWANASSITITSNFVAAKADDTSSAGFENPVYTGTALDTVTTLTATNGDSSSITGINWQDTGIGQVLNFTMEHQRATSFQSHGQSYLNGLYFTADQNASYSLSGAYAMSGDQEIYYYVTLDDITSTQNLFTNEQRSYSTIDESFLLGETGGDSTNSLSGSLTGDLITGHDYSLFFNSYIHAVPASNSIATAAGFVDLTITGEVVVNPVPIPAAIWLFGTALIGLVGFGKRRKAA